MPAEMKTGALWRNFVRLRNSHLSWSTDVRMRMLLLNLLMLSATLASCQHMPGIETGKKAPAFQARDQYGKKWTLSSLMGPNGLVLLFFRSADW